MRRKLILFLTSIFVAAFSAVIFAFPKTTAFAAEDNLIPTEIVLPKSYVEYYDLNSPNDVWTNGTEFVISEADRIIYFDGQKYRTYSHADLSLDGKNKFSKVYKLDNTIVFVYQMYIYTLDVSAAEVSAINTGIQAVSFSFYTNNNITYLVTNIVNSNKVTLNTYKYENGIFNIEPINSNYESNCQNAFCVNPVTGAVYYAHELKIYPSEASLNQNGYTISVRSLSYMNGKIYISADTGIYSIDENGKNLTRLVQTSTDYALGKLVSPQGIFCFGGKLYICDEEINAVSEFDPATNNFTNFHITTNYSHDNRVTKKASDLCVDGDFVYVLDEQNIVKIDSKSGSSNAIKLGNFSGAKHIAATNSTILLGGENVNGSYLKLLSLKDNALTEVSLNGDVDVNQLKNISAICTFENDYYFINNEIINNISKAVIYKVSSKQNKLDRLTEFDGTGLHISSDVFGDIYISVYFENKHSVWLTDINATKPKLVYSSTEDATDIFADYEGNVYTLYSGNRIVKTSADKTQKDFILSLSENLPSSATPVAITSVDSTKKVYILYSGFLLSADSDKLEVATPKRISVPENYCISLNENTQFVTVKNDAKFFEVTLKKTFGDYFDYKDMSSHTNPSEKFVRLVDTDRYTLIANERISAIVRTEDLIASSADTSTAVNKTLYAVNDCNGYNVPIIKDYAANLKINKNDKVNVLLSLSYNGTSYLLVDYNGTHCYAAEKMFKNGIASNLSPKTYTSYVLFKKATYYADNELKTTVGTLKSGTTVKVVKIESGIAEINIDGKLYYIRESALEPKGKTVIKNVILIALCALTVFVTMIYFAVRLFKAKRINK